MLKKSICLLLSACLIWTSGGVVEAVASAPELFAPSSVLPQVRLQPPAELGQVTDFFNAPQRPGALATERQPLIVLIQDLHANYGVQKNIAGLLDFLRGRTAVRPYVSSVPFALAVEGASGPIGHSLLSLYPDRNVALAASDYLLREAMLTGPELFAIQRQAPTLLNGVENESLYTIHRDLFQKTFSDREALVRELSRLQSEIARLPQRKPHALKAFERREKAHAKGRMSASEWERYRASAQGHAGAEARRAFTDRAQIQKDLDLLLRIADLKATESDVRAFAPRLNQFLAMTETLLEVGPGLHPAGAIDAQGMRRLISASIDYYVMAMMRNKPMVENTLALLGERDLKPQTDNLKSQNSLRFKVKDLRFEVRDQPKVAVLVAGGFHTAPITQILREKNISYLVLTPQVEELSEADSELYVKRLNGDYLTPEQIFSDARKHSPNFAKSVGLQESTARRLARLFSRPSQDSLAIGRIPAPVMLSVSATALVAVSAWTTGHFNADSLSQALTSLKHLQQGPDLSAIGPGGWTGLLAALMVGVGVNGTAKAKEKEGSAQDISTLGQGNPAWTELLAKMGVATTEDKEAMPTTEQVPAPTPAPAVSVPSEDSTPSSKPEAKVIIPPGYGFFIVPVDLLSHESVGGKRALRGYGHTVGEILEDIDSRYPDLHILERVNEEIVADPLMGLHDSMERPLTMESETPLTMIHLGATSLAKSSKLRSIYNDIQENQPAQSEMGRVDPQAQGVQSPSKPAMTMEWVYGLGRVVFFFLKDERKVRRWTEIAFPWILEIIPLAAAIENRRVENWFISKHVYSPGTSTLLEFEYRAGLRQGVAYVRDTVEIVALFSAVLTGVFLFVQGSFDLRIIAVVFVTPVVLALSFSHLNWNIKNPDVPLSMGASKWSESGRVNVESLKLAAVGLGVLSLAAGFVKIGFVPLPNLQPLGIGLSRVFTWISQTLWSDALGYFPVISALLVGAYIRFRKNIVPFVPPPPTNSPLAPWRIKEGAPAKRVASDNSDGAGSADMKNPVYSVLKAGSLETTLFVSAGLLIGLALPAGSGLVLAAGWTLLLAGLHGIQVLSGRATFKEVFGFQNGQFWVTMAGTFLAMLGLPYAPVFIQWIVLLLLGELHTWMNLHSQRKELLDTIQKAVMAAKKASGTDQFDGSALVSAALAAIPDIATRNKDLSYAEVTRLRLEFLQQA